MRVQGLRREGSGRSGFRAIRAQSVKGLRFGAQGSRKFRVTRMCKLYARIEHSLVGKFSEKYMGPYLSSSIEADS